MRAAKVGLAQNEWFEIKPQLKRGDHSVVLLERLANALRPKLKIGKRFPWGDTTEDNAPERPSDLMSIDYEVDDACNRMTCCLPGRRLSLKPTKIFSCT